MTYTREVIDRAAAERKAEVDERKATQRQLYKQLCGAPDPVSRDACLSKLEQHLAAYANGFGINRDSVARHFRRKKDADPDGKAANLIEAAQSRRLEILDRISAYGTGNWREDLKTYIRKVEEHAFGDLPIVGGDECDDLWTELMLLKMCRRLPERGTSADGHSEHEEPDSLWADLMALATFERQPDKQEQKKNDLAGRRSDAANEAVCTMLMFSRPAVLVAILRPRKGVTVIEYGFKTVNRLLLNENIRDAKKVLYDDARKSPADADDEDGDQQEERSSQQLTRAQAAEVVSVLTRCFDLPNEMRRAVFKGAWNRLNLNHRKALWLSKIFQDPEAVSVFGNLECPFENRDIKMGQCIEGKDAAQILGITLGAFHVRVCHAKVAFAKCVEEEINHRTAHQTVFAVGKVER